MHYQDVPDFLARVRFRGDSGRALEFAILTAARSGEVLGARWSEIDLEKKLWTVPRERMKAGVAHTVPLSGRAVELLLGLDRSSEFVFPGSKGPLSNMAMAMLMRR